MLVILVRRRQTGRDWDCVKLAKVQTGEKYSQKSSWILRSDSPLSPTYKYASVHI